MTRGKTPGLIGTFIMGIIFAATGLSISYFLGNDINFECSRSSDICVIEESNFLGKIKAKKTIVLRKLAGAEVIEKKDSEEDSTYKVVLITNQGRIPFSNMSSNDRISHRKISDKINSYVNSEQESLIINQSCNIPRVIGFVITGIGGLLLLVAFIGLLKFVILLSK